MTDTDPLDGEPDPFDITEGIARLFGYTGPLYRHIDTCNPADPDPFYRPAIPDVLAQREWLSYAVPVRPPTWRFDGQD